MPDPITGLIAGSAVTGIAGDLFGGNAAGKAANAQINAAGKGIDEQRNQLDAVQKLLQPYIDTGSSAVGGQGDLLGLNGPEAQRTAIAGIQNSPGFSSMIQSGENSILQNASATGGLRGGNIQAALAQFSPQMLANEINNRFSRLGSLSSMGQNSATNLGNFDLTTGNNIATLYGEQGAAQAGKDIAQGQIFGNLINQPIKSFSQGLGYGLF